MRNITCAALALLRQQGDSSETAGTPGPARLKTWYQPKAMQQLWCEARSWCFLSHNPIDAGSFTFHTPYHTFHCPLSLRSDWTPPLPNALSDLSCYLPQAHTFSVMLHFLLGNCTGAKELHSKYFSMPFAVLWGAAANLSLLCVILHGKDYWPHVLTRTSARELLHKPLPCFLRTDPSRKLRWAFPEFPCCLPPLLAMVTRTRPPPCAKAQNENNEEFSSATSWWQWKDWASQFFRDSPCASHKVHDDSKTTLLKGFHIYWQQPIYN